MKLNRKGFTGLEIVFMLLAVSVIGYFAVPPAIKSVGTLWGSGDKNQSKMVHKVKEYRTPFYQDEKGKFVPAPKQDMREEYEENFNSAPVKPTIWEIVKKWAFLIGVLCLIFPTFGIWLFKRFMDLKINLKQLVTGIEEAKKELPPDAIAKLETNLSKKMDTSAKLEVKKIKVKL